LILLSINCNFGFSTSFKHKNVCNNKNGFGLKHAVIFTFDQPRLSLRSGL
jgi:hypothetical protein